MNFLKSRIAAANGTTQVEIPGGQRIELPSADIEAGRDVEIGIRPEHFTLSKQDSGLKLRVSVAENLGSEAILYGDLEGGSPLTVRVDAAERLKSGDLIGLRPRTEHCHLFDDDGKRIAMA